MLRPAARPSEFFEEQLTTQTTIKEKNMQKLRTLLLAAALTVSFAGTIYADGGGSSCEPGQTNTPPCAAAQSAADDDLVPSATIVPSPSNDKSEYSLTQLTLDVVQNLLALF